jgi:signal transduction histidine kinase
VADRLVSELLENTSSIGNKLIAVAANPDENPLSILEMGESSGSDYLALVLESSQLQAFPRGNLLYYPVLPNPSIVSPDLFAVGEAAEFQKNDQAAAASFYRNLAETDEDAVRAGALARLARTLRKLNDWDAAVLAYNELSRMGSVLVNGVPAELLAHFALCTLYNELDDFVGLSREVKFIRDGLNSAKWPLNASSYKFYKQEIQNIGQSLQASTSSKLPELEYGGELILSAGAEELWRQWMRIQQGLAESNGEQCIAVDNASLFTIWRGDPNRVVSVILSSDYIEREWLNPVIQSLMVPQGISLALVDPDGKTVSGTWNEKERYRLVRTSLQSSLPWSMQLTLLDPDSFASTLRGRRQLFWFLLGIMLIIVLLAGYTIVRSTEKELAVARLQGDFVSAVSHEFRTPLASIGHISELLVEGRVPSEEQRQDFYAAIQVESGRLNHLVENILDFRKMEENANEYQMQWLDSSVFFRKLAVDFASEVNHRGYKLKISIEEDIPRIHADHEAISRAIWNLLDNAVKYSKDSRLIEFQAKFSNQWLVVSVKDYGHGIEKSDQDRIFDRFYRASNAKSVGIRGTGLGLAMVRRIVRDHGGYIELESSPGKGSTFSIYLPVERSA